MTASRPKPPTRGERRVLEVRRVAEFLDSIGQPKRANDVRALCRSYATLRATASSIHKELEETRRAAGMPTWERDDSNQEGPARRCDTNIVEGQMGECAACGAAQGQGCLKPNREPPPRNGESF